MAKIRPGELGKEGEELALFLKRLGIKASWSGDELEVEDLSARRLKPYLKRYLHQRGLGSYRVLSREGVLEFVSVKRSEEG